MMVQGEQQPQWHGQQKPGSGGFKLKAMVVATVNFCLSLVARRRRGPGSAPRKVLIANAGHLGDQLIMFPALACLRAQFPEATFALLAPPWSHFAFRGTSFFSRVHALPPFYGDRKKSVFGAVLAWGRQLRRSVRAIRDEQYDLAIDLRKEPPNYSLELALAGIPDRVGFRQALGGPLYNLGFPLSGLKRHESATQMELLAAAGWPPSGAPAPITITPGPEGTLQARRFLEEHCPGGSPYRVLHVGASRPEKEWPAAHWRTLATALLREGVAPVFTGLGARDQILINNIIQGVQGAVSACNGLDWDGLVALVHGADLVYSVDTVTGHLAAALGRPCVSIFGGVEDPSRWAPTGPMVRVVQLGLPCQPCELKFGCPSMACLRDLDPMTVFSVGETLRTPKFKPGEAKAEPTADGAL